MKPVNRSPIFERSEYTAMIPEDTPLEMLIEKVQATDADYGVNAEITYRIQRGAYDDFRIDPVSGEVTLSGKLNYDTRKYYELDIEAVDGGEPSLSGNERLYFPFLIAPICLYCIFFINNALQNQKLTL